MPTINGNTVEGDNTAEEINLVTGGYGGAVVNIKGFGGNDNLIGDGASNIIEGGDGNDVISGGLGFDNLRGDDGDDSFMLNGEVNDPAYNQPDGLTTYYTGNLYDGGNGTDTLRADEDNLTLVLTNTITLGSNGIEAISGGDGLDFTAYNNFRVSGDASGNTLNFRDISLQNVLIDGNVGDDIITGSSTNFGGNGASGDDTLEGGYGNDTVVYWADRSEYVLTVINNPDGTQRLVVAHEYATGEDTGDDTLNGFETLDFLDQVIDISMGAVVDTDGVSGATVAEHLLNGTQVGIDLSSSINANLLAEVSNPGALNLIYRFSPGGNPGGIFAIDPSTGVVTVANAEALDYETAPLIGGGPARGYTILVEATAGGVVSTPVSFDVIVTDTNDPPEPITDTDGSSDMVAEGAANGTEVGITANAIDLNITVPPDPDQVTYSLTDDAGGRFAIHPTTGVITVANGSLLDYETQASWTITVRATDNTSVPGNTNFTERTFVIDLTDETVANWTGTSGADVFVATNGEAWTMDGGDGDDVIVGANLADTITGGEGNDALVGGAGDDVFLFETNSGMDDIFGGMGYDRLEARENGTVIGINSIDSIEEISDGGYSNVSLQAGSGNDNLDFSGTALNGTVLIRAGDGDDTVIGTSGYDHIMGENGNDSLYGGDGEDSFRYSGSATGFDAVDGGNGYDRLIADANNTVITLSAVTSIEELSDGGYSNVSIQGSTDDTLFDFSAVTIYGTIVIRAGAGADTILGWSGNDTIYGEDGDDLIHGGAGSDVLNGGNGNDTVSYAGNWDAITINLGTNAVSGGDATGDTISGFENVIATDYNDTITGSSGANIITGGAGDDTMSGGNGNDTFIIGAGSGTDSINGGGNTDTVLFVDDYATLTVSSLSAVEIFDASLVTGATIVGTSSNNTLNFSSATLTNISGIFGMAGNDTITGSTGADWITGGEGDDTLNGGDGNDVFRFEGGSEGFDAITGGNGTDTIETSAYGVTMGIRSISGIELIYGYGDTIIAGNGSANTLNFSGTTLSGIASIDGGGGNDTITGSAGGDTIYGGNGADTITGGDGADILYGGAGNDIFDFNAISESQFGGYVDQIQDFATGDRIDLSTIDADTVTGGDQAFTFIGASAFSNTAGELRYDTTVVSGLTHIYGDVDGDGIADFEAILTGTYTMAGANFIL